MLLPIAVVQIPLGTLSAIFYFVLYREGYPDADIDSFNRTEGSPGGLLFSLLLMSAAYLLFSLVGAAATIVAARATLEGKPVALAEALDPAFTRMGGLLILGALFYVLAVATVVGVILLLYVMIRWGLAVHVFILEGTSVSGALGGSWRLLRGRMLHFTGVLLTAIPVAAGVFFAATIVLALFLTPFSVDPGRTGTLVAQSIGIALMGFALIPTTAYMGAATTIVYVSWKEQSRV